MEQLRKKYDEEQKYNTGLSKNPSQRSLRKNADEVQA